MVVTTAFTPFWNIKEGESATLLPMAMQITHFSWQERLVIKLLAGVKGETDSVPVQVQIPYGNVWRDM